MVEENGVPGENHWPVASLYYIMLYRVHLDKCMSNVFTTRSGALFFTNVRTSVYTSHI
jgi:hypothetical protein